MARRAPWLAGLLCLASTSVHANGRVPGATGLAIHPGDHNQLLLGLTFGLAITRDGGASWSWMCEQQIEGNGSNVDPAIVLTSNGTLVVLSLTNGGVLVSRDHGCSVERARGPLQGNRGVDLELDPTEPGRVLVLTSTIVDVVESGHARYRNLLAHSLDHGGTWEVLAELPEDLSAETVEIAPSDPRRIYVSGTSSIDALQGIVERSDDGGHTWTRTTVRLPRGSGSLFVSGIHPSDPDRLWFRVPGRGDVYGILPARLWRSTDGAVSFEPVGDTQAGMLGFAVSPDGERIAFGGPTDGLFVAPADASTPAVKVADLHVSCLRWRSNGLYACTIEPADPFTLGFAAEPTQGFTALWRRSDTCREACEAPSTLELTCREPWEMIAPLVDASTAVCGASPAPQDAGAPVEPPRRDGGVASKVDASVPQPRPAASGCTVAAAARSGALWWLAILSVSVLAGCRRRRARTHERMWLGDGAEAKNNGKRGEHVT